MRFETLKWSWKTQSGRRNIGRVGQSVVMLSVWKDFALDPDEARMRMAAHHLVRFMTAGMALITCHEPVLISINGQLKNAFLSTLGVSNSAIVLIPTDIILFCVSLKFALS